MASVAVRRGHLPLGGRRPRTPLRPHPSSPHAPPVVGERLARKGLRPGRYLSSRRGWTAGVAPGRREMPAPPSPLLCRGKKGETLLNTRGRRGSATRKQREQPIKRRRASDVTGSTDVSPPQTRGPPVAAPSKWRRRRRRRRCRRRKGACEPVPLRACALLGPCPLPALRAPPSSRESGDYVSGRAAVLTFCHGAEGGGGRRWRCKSGAQTRPSLPSLGGEKGQRAAGTAAALAGPGQGPLASGASWSPIGCGPREGRSEGSAPELIGYLRCQ